MKALFLDFDGVLIDSRESSYRISKEVAYGFLHFPFEEVEYKTRWMRHRGLVSLTEHYVALHQAVADQMNDPSEDIPEAFDRALKRNSKQGKEHFAYLFDANRAYYRQDIGKLAELNPLTPFGEHLRNKKLVGHFILTTMERDTVEAFCRHFPLKVDGIFAAEDYLPYGSKGAFISHFLDNTEDYDSADFVDDSEKHLRSTEGDYRINPYLAHWGYGADTGTFPHWEF